MNNHNNSLMILTDAFKQQLGANLHITEITTIPVQIPSSQHPDAVVQASVRVEGLGKYSSFGCSSHDTGVDT